MKITIIKPKTKITMKTLTDNLLRPRPIPYLLIAVCCKLSAVRNLLHAAHHCTSITSVLSEPGKAPKCGQNLFMQNEPNFTRHLSKVSAVLIKTYNEKPLVNPKITNPIEPNTNPIGKRPKINVNFCYDRDLQWKNPLVNQNPRTQSNPNRTRYEPKTNPISSPILHGLHLYLLNILTFDVRTFGYYSSANYYLKSVFLLNLARRMLSCGVQIWFCPKCLGKRGNNNCFFGKEVVY